MDFEEKDLVQILNDAEMLTQEEMHEVVGGADPPPCSACCTAYNGGINKD
ncbi:MAG: hypothetical protein J6K31_09245 [Parabacteroides sp.]|nr:hypothetical protein [Parabacteroides sp.]